MSTQLERTARTEVPAAAFTRQIPQDTASRFHRPLAERLSRQVDAGADACWTWTGSTFRSGYGRISVGGKSRLAHRVAYELAVGPIVDGLTLDHLCKNRRCVRPDHLEPVTMAENLRRGDGVAALNARKTHCKVGHPLAGDNLYVRPGGRGCRECNRRRTREYLARKRETA